MGLLQHLSSGRAVFAEKEATVGLLTKASPVGLNKQKAAGVEKAFTGRSVAQSAPLAIPSFFSSLS
jgi:hypothetical protein